VTPEQEGVRILEDDDGGTGDRGPEQGSSHAVGMEERDRAEDGVLRGEAEPAVEVRLGGALAVRSRHHLRPPGRAGGVLVDEDLLGRARGQPLRRAALQQRVEGQRLAVRGAGADHLGRAVEAGDDALADPGGALVADHDPDARGTEAEFQLRLLEGGVDRDDPRAQRGDGVKAGDEPGIVAQRQADRVAGAHTALREAVCDALHPLDQLGVANALVAIDQGRLLRACLRLLVQEAHQHG
jgi:hypothetical protein